jgi:competence ComEA-like helix-hairpin-helix protein
MAVLVFSEPVYRWWIINRAANENEDDDTLDSLVASWKWAKPADSVAKAPARLHPFDPNTASLQDLQSLGLSQKLVNRIVNYRLRGGKFRIKSDLRKIYGLDSSTFLKLNAFINLPDSISTSTPTVSLRKTIPLEPFDLNTADTAKLVKLYGIGPRLSKRIIAYRNRLGGFISMDQLNEVYGLDTAAINLLRKRSFISDDFKPRMININVADQKELNSLPYIKFNLAKSITAYRFQHGEFKSVEELKRIALMDTSVFEKIKPYLTVKD